MVKKKIKRMAKKGRLVKTEKEIALDFAVKVHEKFDKIVKASILFGSQTKGTSTASSDIDIILIIDDAAINWDLELIAWYREELTKLIASSGHAKRLHINSIKLTSWWQDLLYGEPVVINILRYGEALIDYGGFFEPLKALLLEGKMRSTPEAIYASLQRAPGHLARSKASEMSAIEGVYWTMIDSAQAALMTAGKIPPSPEHVPDLLKETFVDTGLLSISYVKALIDLLGLHKSITHGTLREIRGVEIDKWQDVGERFLREMTRIIDKLVELKK